MLNQTIFKFSLRCHHGLIFIILKKNDISSSGHMTDFPEICRHLPSVTQQNQRHQNQEQVLWPEYSANIPPHQKFSLAYLFPGLSVWAAVSNMEPWPAQTPRLGRSWCLTTNQGTDCSAFHSNCDLLHIYSSQAIYGKDNSIVWVDLLILSGTIVYRIRTSWHQSRQNRATVMKRLFNTCDKHVKKIGAWNFVHFQMTLSRLRDLNLEFQKLKCVFSQQGPVQNIQTNIFIGLFAFLQSNLVVPWLKLYKVGLCMIE